MKLTRMTQIKAQCGPRKKIVAHPCPKGTSYVLIMKICVSFDSFCTVAVIVVVVQEKCNLIYFLITTPIVPNLAYALSLKNRRSRSLYTFITTFQKKPTNLEKVLLNS